MLSSHDVLRLREVRDLLGILQPEMESYGLTLSGLGEGGGRAELQSGTPAFKALFCPLFVWERLLPRESEKLLARLLSILSSECISCKLLLKLHLPAHSSEWREARFQHRCRDCSPTFSPISQRFSVLSGTLLVSLGEKRMILMTVIFHFPDPAQCTFKIRKFY